MDHAEVFSHSSFFGSLPLDLWHRWIFAGSSTKVSLDSLYNAPILLSAQLHLSAQFESVLCSISLPFSATRSILEDSSSLCGNFPPAVMTRRKQPKKGYQGSKKPSHACHCPKNKDTKHQPVQRGRGRCPKNKEAKDLRDGPKNQEAEDLRDGQKNKDTRGQPDKHGCCPKDLRDGRKNKDTKDLQNEYPGDVAKNEYPCGSAKNQPVNLWENHARLLDNHALDKEGLVLRDNRTGEKDNGAGDGVPEDLRDNHASVKKNEAMVLPDKRAGDSVKNKVSKKQRGDSAKPQDKKAEDALTKTETVVRYRNCTDTPSLVCFVIPTVAKQHPHNSWLSPFPIRILTK